MQLSDLKNNQKPNPNLKKDFCNDDLDIFSDDDTPSIPKSKPEPTIPVRTINADHERIPREEVTPKTERPLIEMDIDCGVFVINKSLIGQFMYNGQEEPHCPYQVFMHYISKEWESKPTESMQKGLFFETLTIGQSADGTGVTDLPRGKKGNKSVDQIRIEEQALIFNQMYPQYHMIIIKEGRNRNVQIPFCTEWKDPKYKNFDDLKIYLKGVIDIVSPISVGHYNYNMCIIDLKLTKNRFSTYGKYSWGNVEQMDHTQPLLYSYGTGLPFMYWVFDYQADNDKRGHKFFPVKTQNAEDSADPELQTRYNEFHETIRKTIRYLIQYHNEGWPRKANYDSCKNCIDNPVNGGTCPCSNNIQEV